MSGNSKRNLNAFITIVVATATVFLQTGCSTPQVTPAMQSGLFQTTVSGGTELSGQPNLRSDDGFAWPLKEGSISSFFGKRRRDYHDGVDIRAPQGTPVYSAKAGQVIYSSRKIRGYGNMIVLKHPDGMATVYAHNKKNLVKLGDRVKDGQLIAYVGRTGKATGPHLHFEIRKGEVAQDPIPYLPRLSGRAVATLH